MCPEATTFIQNGFVLAIYTKQISFINTLEFQISQVWYTSDIEVIKYMCKSLNHMQVSVYKKHNIKTQFTWVYTISKNNTSTNVAGFANNFAIFQKL